MGREARCMCRWHSVEGMVTALLESHELILRGDIKRRVPIASITNVRVEGGDLRFNVGAEAASLALGADEAARWATKILTPPPSLRQKIGVGPDAKALVVGPVRATALVDALRDATTALPADAKLLVAVVANAADIGAAIQIHRDLPSGSPIWVVHGKGRGAAFGESAVRDSMRGSGFVDTKVAAVSDDCSATRYSKRRPSAGAK